SPAASCSAAAAARSGASPRFSAGSRTSLKASSFLSCRPDRSRNCRSRSWLLDGKSLVRPRMKDPWQREIVGGAEADEHGGREAQSASRIRPRSPLGHRRRFRRIELMYAKDLKPEKLRWRVSPADPWCGLEFEPGSLRREAW